MDIQFIDSLVGCTKEILEEVVSVNTIDTRRSIQQGANTFEGNGVILKVEGDIEGHIIFDLSKELFSHIALATAGETDLWSLAETKEEYNELLKSVVLEWGNLINGRIISAMHTHNYKCKSMPEEAYYENYSVLAPKNITTVVVEAKTSYGEYRIYITNKKEKFTENISILLYGILPDIQKVLITRYIPKGYFFLKTQDLKSAELMIRDKTINFLLINIDEIADAPGFVQSLIRIQPDIKVIVFSTGERYTEFHGVISINVVGYISNTLPTETIIKNLEHFLEKEGIRKTERRKHFRIKVSLMDNARIEFQFQGKLIAGDIIDIGLGGLKFALDGKVKVEKFEFGQELDNIKLIISGERIKLKGSIRSFRDNNVNIEILDFYENGRDLLSEYISERVSEDRPL